MKNVQLKRIYEQAEQSDGRRVLVDRIWPRGISKDRAQLDVWMKEIAPSAELCKWFGHVPEKFTEFSQRYQAEIQGDETRQECLSQLREWASEGTVTLVYAAKDEAHNQALVLKQLVSPNS